MLYKLTLYLIFSKIYCDFQEQNGYLKNGFS